MLLYLNIIFILGPRSARNKRHIFLSYSWNEKDIIYELKDRLKVGLKLSGSEVMMLYTLCQNYFTYIKEN